MTTTDAFRELALSFPGAAENPHFDRTAFRARRIFATLHEPSRTANVRLTEADQAAFCDLGANAVYPVANKWGLQGWTTFELSKVPREAVLDALECAYKHARQKKRAG